MEEGLPTPELQRQVLGPAGQLVARVDFLWDEHQTIGEFDGKIKYGCLLKPGRRIEGVIFDEKLREDAVRDLGFSCPLDLATFIARHTSAASAPGVCPKHHLLGLGISAAEPRPRN